MTTNNNQQLTIGYDTTFNLGYIQAQKVGTSTEPLLLNPLGGNVGINKSNPGTALDVTGTVTNTGLIVNGSSVMSGGIQYDTRTITSSITLDNTYYLVRVNGSGVTITLPTVASYPGQMYILFNVTSNIVTISCELSFTLALCMSPLNIVKPF